MNSKLKLSSWKEKKQTFECKSLKIIVCEDLHNILLTICYWFVFICFQSFIFNFAFWFSFNHSNHAMNFMTYIECNRILMLNFWNKQCLSNCWVWSLLQSYRNYVIIKPIRNSLRAKDYSSMCFSYGSQSQQSTKADSRYFWIFFNTTRWLKMRFSKHNSFIEFIIIININFYNDIDKKLNYKCSRALKIIVEECDFNLILISVQCMHTISCNFLFFLLLLHFTNLLNRMQ